jgi:hypothetical protein
MSLIGSWRAMKRDRVALSIGFIGTDQGETAGGVSSSPSVRWPSRRLDLLQGGRAATRRCRESTPAALPTWRAGRMNWSGAIRKAYPPSRPSTRSRSSTQIRIVALTDSAQARPAPFAPLRAPARPNSGGLLPFASMRLPLGPFLRRSAPSGWRCLAWSVDAGPVTRDYAREPGRTCSPVVRQSDTETTGNNRIQPESIRLAMRFSAWLCDTSIMWIIVFTVVYVL